MAAKTLSQKAIEIAIESSGRNRTRQLQELLVPKNSEMKIGDVKWRPCKGGW
jgi:hypothetical protein